MSPCLRPTLPHPQTPSLGEGAPPQKRRAAYGLLINGTDPPGGQEMPRSGISSLLTFGPLLPPRHIECTEGRFRVKAAGKTAVRAKNVAASTNRTHRLAFFCQGGKRPLS